VSLVETIVSMALTVALSGTIMSLLVAGQTIARTQPESADVQQRARVALRVLAADLADAGAGLEHGSLAGPLVRHFPPIVPAAGGLTLWTATTREAQASPAFIVSPGATTVTLQDVAACPSGQPACGFADGSTAIAFTAGGCRTTMQIAAAGADALQLAAPLSGCALDPSSAVAAGVVRTYRLDTAARQLIRRDEATGSSSPLLDGVAAFTAELYADGAAGQPITGVTDADLMRVRLVRVSLRFVASNPLLHIPDLAVSMDVAPRNLEDR
jgi:hypothetical protein